MIEKENNSKSNLVQEKELNEKKVNQDQWCYCYNADVELHGEKEKAGLLIGAKWQSGDSISISFLNGDSEVHQKVIKSAMKWIDEGGANLKFLFRLEENITENIDIRISFDRPGSWSVLGTTCKKITNQNEPTMNFGWLNKNSSEEIIDRVVLHEFGHAIGLIHEHMIPDGIEWNRDQVIADLNGPPNNWSLKSIENNMFRIFEKSELELTRMDKDSIMMYPIPAKWTKNGISTGLNSSLSKTDIEFIRKAYPGKTTLNFF